MDDTRYRRINARFALAYDKHQWILQRGSKRKGEDDWKAVAFITSNKYQLFRIKIREGVPKDDALDLCETLPETFTEFLALQGTEERRSASESAPS